jgi:hypothetical protein
MSSLSSDAMIWPDPLDLGYQQVRIMGFSRSDFNKRWKYFLAHGNPSSLSE